MIKLLLADKFILALILINGLLLFVSGFEINDHLLFALNIADQSITLIFIAEIFAKFKAFGIKSYFTSNWNKFDFALVVFSIPAFISFFLHNQINPAFNYLLIFRVFRVFKSFRFLKFIPGIDDLVLGIKRALRASVVVFIGFTVYIFVIGILSFYLFNEVAPSLFSNPLSALYTIFKIFTVEGWYEIPEKITFGMSNVQAFFTYFYFIFVLLTGGIFGFSLVNSIFVDAMVSDNNDDIEAKIDRLELKINELLAQKNREN